MRIRRKTSRQATAIKAQQKMDIDIGGEHFTVHPGDYVVHWDDGEVGWLTEAEFQRDYERVPDPVVIHPNHPPGTRKLPSYDEPWVKPRTYGGSVIPLGNAAGARSGIDTDDLGRRTDNLRYDS